MKINLNLNQIFHNINNVVAKKNIKEKHPQGKANYFRPTEHITNIHILDGHYKFNKINPFQLNQLLRELLNLPKDFKTLLQNISGKNENILLPQLQEILQSNSKDVINKLLKLIQTNSSNMQNLDQLKELMSILGQIIPNNKTTQQEIIKDTLLLYLPYLPLPHPKEIELELGTNNAEETQENLTITIYLITENFGTLKLLLFEDKENKVIIDINATNTPENFDIKELSKIITNETKTNAVSSEVNIQETKTEIKESNNNKQAIIDAKSGVSAKLLLAAHSVLKAITEADNKKSLISQRKAKLKT